MIFHCSFGLIGKSPAAHNARAAYRTEPMHCAGAPAGFGIDIPVRLTTD